MEREKFSSRLGFILISAGCAIGLGNVYRFPIITGAYGGALFVLIYLAFLLMLGIPVMCAELSVGRASQRSIATSFETLEKPGQKWHVRHLPSRAIEAGRFLPAAHQKSVRYEHLPDWKRQWSEGFHWLSWPCRILCLHSGPQTWSSHPQPTPSFPV